MMKLSGFCAVLALSAGLGLPLCAETAATPAPVTAETVVATVNGVNITMGDVIITREGLPDQYKALPDDQLFKGLVDQLVQQEVLRQSAGETLTPKQTRALAALQRNYLANESLLAGIKDATSDAEIQKAYDAKYAHIDPALEYHAAHILVDSEEKANQLLKEIQGGKDFAEVAKANSTDGSAATGGDLGWFGLGVMVKPFEDAVVAAKVGEVIGPIKSDFGWHLILVSETRNKAAPALEEVKPQIAAELQKAAIDAFIKAKMDGAKVERPDITAIDPAAIKDTALLDK
jgi:peptidyl-prolyl cis-trans isomerase C